MPSEEKDENKLNPDEINIDDDDDDEEDMDEIDEEDEENIEQAGRTSQIENE